MDTTRLVEIKRVTMIVVVVVVTRITTIMVVEVTRINLEDDFHKRVECVLLLLPGQDCITTHHHSIEQLSST